MGAKTHNLDGRLSCAKPHSGCVGWWTSRTAVCNLHAQHRALSLYLCTSTGSFFDTVCAMPPRIIRLPENAMPRCFDGRSRHCATMAMLRLILRKISHRASRQRSGREASLPWY